MGVVLPLLGLIIGSRLMLAIVFYAISHLHVEGDVVDFS
jgi:hypothetical protein